MDSNPSTANTRNNQLDLISTRDKKISWTEAIKMLTDLSNQ